MNRLNVILAAAALFAASAYLAEIPLVGDDSEIRVTARKYEFSPNQITVKREVFISGWSLQRSIEITGLSWKPSMLTNNCQKDKPLQ